MVNGHSSSDSQRIVNSYIAGFEGQGFSETLHWERPWRFGRSMQGEKPLPPSDLRFLSGVEEEEILAFYSQWYRSTLALEAVSAPGGK